MRLLKVGAAIVLAALLLGGLLVFRALARLRTPEFKEQLLREAQARLGLEVQAQSLEFSLFEGLRLAGVTIANPPGFPGRLASADAFVLRYRLLPLLRGQLEISELSLRKPVVQLTSDARGVFNYEKALATGPAGSGRTGGATSAGPAFLRRVVIKRLAMEHGNLTLADGKAVLLRVEGQDFESAISVTDAAAAGKGKASIDTLALADALFLRDIRAPLALSPELMRLRPVEARLAGGVVGGELVFRLKPSLRYSMNLEVGGASLATLLKEAARPPSATGKLAAKAALSGTGGLASLRGRGQAEVQDCALSQVAAMKLLSLALQLPELADPRFEQCRVEFELTGPLARTPVLVLKGPALELTGKGTYNLQSSALQYAMTLILPERVYHKVTASVVRGAFKERADGTASIDFTLTGTTADPKLDLTTRLAKAGAAGAVKAGFGKLFGKKKQPR